MPSWNAGDRGEGIDESKVKLVGGCICNSGQPVSTVPGHIQSEVD